MSMTGGGGDLTACIARVHHFKLGQAYMIYMFPIGLLKHASYFGILQPYVAVFDPAMYRKNESLAWKKDSLY